MKVPTADNVSYYAKIVQEKHAARRLMLAASEISAKGYEDYGDIQDYLDEAEAKIFEVTQRGGSTGPELIKVLIKEVFSSLDERFAAPGGITGVPTGFIDLDNRTAGLQPTELIILAARPAMGKTSFAMSIAQNCSDPERGGCSKVHRAACSNGDHERESLPGRDGEEVVRQPGRRSRGRCRRADLNQAAPPGQRARG